MAETITDEVGREIPAAPPKSAPKPRPPLKASASTRWDSLPGDITPALIVSWVQAADNGSPGQLEQLFDRMVDRDLRLQAVLATRRNAVSGADWSVVAADDSDAAQRAAEYVDAELVRLEIEEAVDVLLDAVPKGRQVQEIVWKGSQVTRLVEVSGRDLRWRDGVLQVKTGDSIDDWQPLETHRFIVHSPRLKSGFPERRGMLRSMAMLWCAKHWALRDWAAFAEVFGVPLRLGKYPEHSDEEDIDALEEALAMLGADASAAIPADMSIEFPRPANVGSSTSKTPMQDLIEYIDREYAIGALGQNLTTEGVSGSGTLAGGAHNNVRADYRIADAKALAKTLRRDLLTPMVGYALGWGVPVPYVVFDVEDAGDEALRAATLKTLHEIGLPLSAAQLRDEFAVREPDDDDDVIAPAQSGGGLGLPFSDDRRVRLPVLPPSGPRDAFRSKSSAAQRAGDKVAEKAAEAAHGGIRKVLSLIEDYARRSSTPEEVMRRIQAGAADLDGTLAEAGIDNDDLADLAARTMATAMLNGRVSVRTEIEGA